MANEMNRQSSTKH